MKKFLLILIFLTLPLTTHAKVKIVTTLPIFGALADAVGGERVQIKALARPNQDPHFLPAKPAYAVALNRAQILIHNGMDLEIGWLPPVLLQSRNPKIQFNAIGNVNASVGINPLDVPTGVVNRSKGDVHPLGNPHYFLDPRTGGVIAENIFKHLVEVDPEGEAYYQNRLKAFQIKLNQKIQEWSQTSSGIKNAKFITYHKTWPYLANWLQLDIIGNIEPKPGIPPNAKHTDWLLKMIPQNQVQAILMAPYYPKKVPEFISQKTGLPLMILATSTAGTKEGDYFELFQGIVSSLKQNKKP